MVCCSSQYDKMVTIQKIDNTVSTDSAGFRDRTLDSSWTKYTDSYAACQSRGGREFWKVDQVAADVSHVWRCPYSERLAAATPDMRLRHEGVTYNILSVIDIDLAHQEVEIQTRKAV